MLNLKSLPFALMLAFTPLCISTGQAQTVTAHRIGDFYEGGIIFYVSADGQHGLIAAKEDQGGRRPWSNVTYTAGATTFNANYTVTGTSGDGLFAGVMNTALIVGTQIHYNPTGIFAGLVAANFSIQSDGISNCASNATGEMCFGDWYLPSLTEMSQLVQVNHQYPEYGLNLVKCSTVTKSAYWTSTESNGADEATNAWVVDTCGTGATATADKSVLFLTRPVRAF